MPRRSLRSALVLFMPALLPLSACLEHPLKPVEYEASQEDEGIIAIDINKNVDILFVIDNSGSMGEEQLNLSRNFGAFLEVLDRPNVRANYRIAFTTTDNGNPSGLCPGTGPEGGSFVLSSCRSRISDFSIGGVNPEDETEACLATCPEAFQDIAITPTTTLHDDVPRPHKWIESIDGVTNLPEGITTAQAMSCFGPQGINGCGFESHLESMYKALRKTADTRSASYGFMRDDAILAIVFVTDEVDCSVNGDWSEIFDRDGNRVFWSTPDTGNPTSALCWNAGVACTEDGAGTYAECHAANFDVDGRPVPDERASDDAVLHPLSRYIDYVQAIEDEKKERFEGAEVLVSLIAGVPSEYPDQPIVYQDAPQGTLHDPQYQDKYGIGPGCSSVNGEAVPPVREREFAEAFTPAEGSSNIFSVCNDDYSLALESIARAIEGQFRPPCMPACVADTNPSTPDTLDEECVLVKRVAFADGRAQEFPIPECLDATGTIPDGAAHCYVAIDVENDLDRASPACIEAGYNLEFALFDRPNSGQPRGIGSTIDARCKLSSQKAYDCPRLDP